MKKRHDINNLAIEKNADVLLLSSKKDRAKTESRHMIESKRISEILIK